jgi:hypothetical protein
VSDHHSAKAPVGKQMSRDLFFPTPIYYTDLADADAINARVKALIRAWRDDDPQGQFRTNEPWLGGWHSPTDMHTRREYDCLTREIFELMHGVYASLGYDPDYEPVCDSMSPCGVGCTTCRRRPSAVCCTSPTPARRPR